MSPLEFVVPGPLDQVTGGYLFDRRLVDGLRACDRPVGVHELEGRFPEADATARSAAAALLEALPDDRLVVVDGLALPGFEGCLAVHARRLRLVGFVHHPLSAEAGADPGRLERFAALEARLWPMLRGVVCASAHTARAVIATGLAPERVAIAPPGTDPCAPYAPRREAGGPLRLLAVGTVTPRKGHAVLVEALAGLGGLDWFLDCVGSLDRDPGCVAAVREAIAAHRLDDRIALHGELPAAALEAAWRRADAFVLPSLHEGYGMAFAEALAHGLPVVATTAGALPETVPDDASLSVPPGDVEALRAALARLLAEPALRASLATGARRAGAALVDWPAAVHRWIAAVDRLAA